MIAKNQLQLFVHPVSITELNKDSNQDRKQKILSKIQTYSNLEQPPDFSMDQTYLSIVEENETNENSLRDNAILFAVYHDAVDFLITEDKGILKKAVRLNIKHRVFTIIEAIHTIRVLYPDIKVPFSLMFISMLSAVIKPWLSMMQ